MTRKSTKIVTKVGKKTTKKATNKVSKKKVSGKPSGNKKATKKKLSVVKKRAEEVVTQKIIEIPANPKKLELKSYRIHGNDEKRRIAIDMLERYNRHSIKDFQKQIILTNFHYYIERFNELLPDAKYTKGSAFGASSSKRAKVTIIEFGVGSAMAALIGELISVIEPKAALFLGLAGAVHQSLKVGDFVLPIASIRAESVSKNFLPMQVPAFQLLKFKKFISQILVEHGYEYRTGTIHSTDYRFWEFDQRFKDNLIEERVLAVEMETAALFTTCFVSKVNIGALLLISDCPMKPGGIKTKSSAKKVFREFTDIHIELGIKAMADIAERGEKIRHYTW